MNNTVVRCARVHQNGSIGKGLFFAALVDRVNKMSNLNYLILR